MTDKKSKPKHALLVWATIPEAIDYFLIPLDELSKQERKWLRRCHGNYVNSSGVVFNGKFTQKQIDHALSMVMELVANPDADWLNDEPKYFEMQSKQYKITVEEFSSMYGSWHKYKLSISKPASIPRCRLVQSGFLL